MTDEYEAAMLLDAALRMKQCQEIADALRSDFSIFVSPVVVHAVLTQAENMDIIDPWESWQS